MLTPNQVHVDQALSQVSVAFPNPGFVIHSVFPTIPVDKQSDIYYRFSKQHFRQVPDTAGPGSDPAELPFDLDARGMYFCDGHKLDSPMPDEVTANADPGADLEIEQTEKLTAAVQLNEEINGAAMLNATNITQNTTLVGPTQWSDYVNSDPILEVEARKTTIRNSTGLMADSLLISEYTFFKLRNHPKVMNRVIYTESGLHQPLSAEQLALAFGLRQVVVAAALKQNVLEGRADALTGIWGKNAVLFAAPARAGKRVASLGYTFVWMVSAGGDGKLRGDLNSPNGGYLIKRFRFEHRDSDVLGIRYYYDQRLVEPNAAFLWINAVA